MKNQASSWTKLRLLVSIGLSIVFPTFAAADDALRGLQVVKIVVEQMDDAAAKCGIHRDSIDAALRVPLASSKLKVVKDEELAPYLYARVTALHFRNRQCICALEIQLKRIVWLYPNAPLTGYVLATVWSDGRLMADEAGSIGSSVRDAAERTTKDFLGAWYKAND